MRRSAFIVASMAIWEKKQCWKLHWKPKEAKQREPSTNQSQIVNSIEKIKEISLMVDDKRDIVDFTQVWILDSGASTHVCNQKELMEVLQELERPVQLIAVGGR